MTLDKYSMGFAFRTVDNRHLPKKERMGECEETIHYVYSKCGTCHKKLEVPRNFKEADIIYKVMNIDINRERVKDFPETKERFQTDEFHMQTWKIQSINKVV